MSSQHFQELFLKIIMITIIIFITWRFSFSKIETQFYHHKNTFLKHQKYIYGNAIFDSLKLIYE